MNDTVDIRWPEVGRYGMRWRHICRRTREFARYLGKAPRVVSSRAPLFGYVLHYGGYGLNYLGCALVAFGIFTMEEHVGIDEVIDGPVGVGVLLVFLTLMTGQFGERLLQPTADERLTADRRKPIVLLRSFCDDDVQLVIRYQSAGESGGFIIERFEEALAVQFQRYGPFVAVGKPGEPKPLLGAARKYRPWIEDFSANY